LLPSSSQHTFPWDDDDSFLFKNSFKINGSIIMKPRLLILSAIIITILLLNIPQNSKANTYSQTFYVRPPGTQYGIGDGSDWTNAFSDLPDDLVRDAKYYVASGIYHTGSSDVYHIFNDAEQGILYIGIIKATADDHGTEIGWQDSFGQDTAQLGSIQFITGYYEIDGQVGSGTQGHGFKLYTATCDTHQKAVYFPWNSTSTHIELRHINIGLCGSTTFTAPQDAIYSHYAVSDIIVSDCYIHDVNRVHMMMINWSDVLIEDNYFARSGHQQESHGLGMRDVSNITIRNNVFEDAKNGYINLREVTDVSIYSNVFKRSADGDFSVYALIDNYDYATNLFIYNNTIYNVQGLNAGVRIVGTRNNVQVYNNLWVGSRANQIQLTGTHDYNAFYDNWRVDSEGNLITDLDQQMIDNNAEPHLQVFAENPLASPENGDFQLTFPTDSGLTLSAPFNYDPDGRLRGEDGVWDRGAYEFAPAVRLTGTPGNSTVQLNWQVNTEPPAGITWRIIYTGTQGTPPSPISGLAQSTRSYSLSNLTNYEWYTITLQALDGGDVILSDTVMVMPTDMFVFLPVVRK